MILLMCMCVPKMHDLIVCTYYYVIHLHPCRLVWVINIGIILIPQSRSVTAEHPEAQCYTKPCLFGSILGSFKIPCFSKIT